MMFCVLVFSSHLDVCFRMVLGGQVSSLERRDHARCIDNHALLFTYFVGGIVLKKRTVLLAFSAFHYVVDALYLFVFLGISRSRRLYHFLAFFFAVSL